MKKKNVRRETSSYRSSWVCGRIRTYKWAAAAAATTFGFASKLDILYAVLRFFFLYAYGKYSINARNASQFRVFSGSSFRYIPLIELTNSRIESEKNINGQPSDFLVESTKVHYFFVNLKKIYNVHELIHTVGRTYAKVYFISTYNFEPLVL